MESAPGWAHLGPIRACPAKCACIRFSASRARRRSGCHPHAIRDAQRKSVRARVHASVMWRPRKRRPPETVTTPLCSSALLCVLLPCFGTCPLFRFSSARSPLRGKLHSNQRRALCVPTPALRPRNAGVKIKKRCSSKPELWESDSGHNSGIPLGTPGPDVRHS